MHHQCCCFYKAAGLLAFVLFTGCQSKNVGENGVQAYAGPPALEDVSSPEIGAAALNASQADSIAARARRDLLESMALNPQMGMPAEGSSEVNKGDMPLVTWNEPGVEVEQPVQNPPGPRTQEVSIQSTSTAPRSIPSIADELARALHHRSTIGQTPMRDLTVVAALSILDANRSIQPEIHDSLTAEQTAVLDALQQWFLVLEHGIDDRDGALTMLAESVHGLQASLQQKPNFKLAQKSLVTRVGGFGDVDEWTLRSEHDEYNFIAHSGQEIILYLELEGFESRLDTKGQWETATSQQLVIYSDRDGIPVWRESWQTATDLSRTRRSDYFTAQKMKIPTNLSVGKYQLKVRIRDEQTQAESEATIPFVMTAAALAP